MNPVERLRAGRARLWETVFTEDGLDWCREHAELVDAFVRDLYVEACEDLRPKLSVAATGGYGRRELSPFSDVDLTVVAQDDIDPHVDIVLRRFHRLLNDSVRQVGLEVGFAFRLVTDADGLDGETRTGLTDARFLAGLHAPLDDLLKALWEEFPVGEFLLEKLEERRSAEERTHDTPLVVEPHLKEGAGGLRSFQCANWIRLAIGERPVRPSAAYEVLLRARNRLHAVGERKLDHLTRSRQAEISDRMETTPFDLLAEITPAMIQLHSEFERATDRMRDGRFPLGPGVEAIRGEARVTGGADPGKAAAGIALASQLGLRVADTPPGVGATVSGHDAYYAITKGEAVIRAIDRAGLLEAAFPELAAVRTLMPRDSTHRYTVFEHTLRVVRNIERADDFYGRIRDSLRDKAPILFAAICHDLGKIDRSRSHSEVGADIVREVGDRWGLDAVVVEDVAWLVLRHLEMARFIRMRDVDHPETAEDFAKIVGTRYRLELLTLLTFADIDAVGPDIFTPVQDAFLRQLFERTAKLLDEESPRELAPAAYRQRLHREIGSAQIDPERLEAFLSGLPAHYLVSTPSDLVRMHFHYADRARAGVNTVEVFHLPDLSASEVTIACLDQVGLLSRLLGVFYALDLNVHRMKVSTAAGDPAVALDTFTVSFGGKPLPEATAKTLNHTLMTVMSGEQSVDELLRSKGKDPEQRQKVFSRQFVAGASGILEVQAPRGRGMAFRLSRRLADLGWNVQAARVSQWAGRGSAAFYITGPCERPLTIEEVEAAFAPQV